MPWAAAKQLAFLVLQAVGVAGVVLRAAQTPATSADVANAAAAAAAAAAATRDALKTAGAAATATPVASELFIHEGSSEDWHPFDGIGALSAGASSRLLLDYPEAQRSEILDLLFKPQYGASIQVLKIEIGGDTQSTDGSEPSHLRYKDEHVNCTRGYETWLLKEAKARNPRIKTYGLAWGVPGWIGDGNFFSKDNIRYHVSWLQCIRDSYGFDVDYLGVWNEMPWGQVWYVEELRQAILQAGLPAELVLLDAIHGVDKGFTSLFSSNATFRNMVAAVGMHYPCEEGAHLAGLAEALAHRKETRFWASEELSTVADWGGAGCWGRMINQNFVRMNATSSIAWSLIWSAYPNLECFGNGLLYAFEPWSGHFDVMPPVWTMAHTSQFSEVGWKYLPVGQASGILPGGGTFVTLVSPAMDDFTMVFETLRGQCFYHAGCFHTVEAKALQTLHVKLASKNLTEAAKGRGNRLEVWTTTEGKWFQRQVDVHVDETGGFHIDVPVDAIVTVTTRPGASYRGDRQDAAVQHHPALSQSKQMGAVDPASTPFPLPYVDNFEAYAEFQTPRFFADQGGAFEVVKSTDAPSGRGHVLQQQVLTPPIAWIGKSPEPYTLVGGVNWTDVAAEVNGRLDATDIRPAAGSPARKELSRHIGLCVRLARYYYFGSNPAPDAYCMRLEADPVPAWSLTSSGQRLAGGPLPGKLAKALTSNAWLKLRMEAQGASIIAAVDDQQLGQVMDSDLPFGQVALECGYHKCQFDDLSVSKLSAASSEAVALQTTRAAMPKAMQQQRRTLIRRVRGVSFEYHGRTCEPPPRLLRKRSDFTGFVGLSFTPKKAVLVEGLGRMAVPGGHPWSRVHNISLFKSSQPEAPIATVALPVGVTDQVGIETTPDGWVLAMLKTPVKLEANMKYQLVSSELKGGDSFYDMARLDVDSDVASALPVYLDTTGWHTYDMPMQGYGPLNAFLAECPDDVSVEPKMYPIKPCQGAACKEKEAVRPVVNTWPRTTTTSCPDCKTGPVSIKAKIFPEADAGPEENSAVAARGLLASTLVVAALGSVNAAAQQ
eukprot:TRINITY_DN112614_c0_g1_i1.p1 TRINITY_DN112614_c0_g1~~TRINITY_DN112614_c0_g1_i1.p1  ORF type:complete len:1055 (-),score=243.16 TRINITY_DN112614_c0_g1_i1:106-3270(-)